MAELVLRVPQLLGPPMHPTFLRSSSPSRLEADFFPWGWQVGKANPSKTPFYFCGLLSSNHPAPPCYPAELARQATSNSNS